ncbi:hypothetical protein LSTR_LSTR005563 [Laodelphax striatellus]|uniref:NADH dehydrogenase [ubiquinone] 1 beta subcomplex subunit 5, mitochondrial n=1 Tax=Laodelphax striatellus TaxID=195883 RepID=A0A482WY06_LAOST|nr:hypothetical protein LSTR_LSTR005563 [Laodelphax striatellus]
MTIFSSLRHYPWTKSVSSLLNNRVILKDAPKRCMGEHRVMQIVPSRFQYQKFKDLLHLYIAVAAIPIGLTITYVNIFIGQAQLTEIPEGYHPKHWEYYKHPITRFISRYIRTSPQQEYEKHMHWLYECDERAKIGRLENKVKALMRDRSDYQAFYYFPIDPKYARIVKEDKEEMEKYMMGDDTEEFDGPPMKKAMIVDNNSSNDGKSPSVKAQDSVIQDVRKMLKEENALKAVHVLLNATRNNPRVDYIYNYIKAGGGPLEILKVLHQCENKKDLSFVCPIFSAVHLVLMKIMSDFPHLEQSAEEACIYLLHECTPVLHLMINFKSPMENKKLALSLLTAVVSLSFRLARDVLTSFDLDFKAVEHLAEQVNPTDINSVRVKFIHFVIAFMVEGNPLLIKQLLQNKGVLRLILKDMVYDHSSTVELLLTTLHQKVVLNYSIPKTTKMHAFNTAVMILLIDLYSWRGPKKWTHKRQSAAELKFVDSEGLDEEKGKVRHCVHELLSILCTSHKQGVVFEDRLLGTSQCQNVIARTLFKNLEMAWNDDLAKDLTLKILTANPDLIKPALISIKSAFEPSSTTAWLSTCSFLRKLVESVQIDVKYLTDMNIEHYMKVVMSHSMSPLVIQHICSEKALKHPDAAVRFSCITYLYTCLKKLQSCIKYLKDNSPHDVSSLVSKHLSMVAPKIELLLTAWTLKNSTEVEETPLEIPSLPEYFSAVIDTVLLLHHLVPDYLYLENTDIIDTTLLSSLDDSDDSNSGTLKLKIMRVVSILKPLDPMTESFSIALDLHINHLSNPESCYEAREGLEKLLLNTGLFDSAENELEIWLYCLELIGNDDSVKAFFLKVIRQSIRNIGSYFKCLVEVHDSVASSSQGKSTSTIDEVMEMLENDESSEEKCHSFFKHSQNISPLIPAMLDLLNSKKQSKYQNIVKDFSSLVLIYLLHFQDYPEKVHLLVQKFSNQNKSEVNDYIATWCHGDIRSCDFPSLSSNSIDSKLSKIFRNPEKSSKLAKKVLECIEKQNVNFVLLLRSVLFYITQFHRHDILTLDLLEISLEMIKRLTSCTSSAGSLSSVIASAILHPVIVSGFLPSKPNTNVNFSNILIHFINVANNTISDQNQLKEMLSPCVDKLFEKLLPVLKKKKELKNRETILSLIEALPLSADEIQLILNKIVATEERDYVLDNWIDIESLLLKKCEEKSIMLSDSIASFIVTQLVDEGSEINQLHSSFLKYIKRFPHYLERISDGEFQNILKLITPSKGNLLELSQFLISRKESFVSCLYEEEALHTMPSVFFPLLSKIDMKHCKTKKIGKILSRQIEKIHDAVLKKDAWLVDNYPFVSTLISKCMDDASKSSLYKSLKSDWNRVPQEQSTFSIVKSTIEGKNEAVQFVSDLFQILLETINSRAKGYEWICQTITETIKSSEKVNFSSLVNDNLWNKLVQAALKWGLDGQKMCSSSIWLMRMLRELCTSVFNESGTDQVAEIFELTLSHSNFINILLDASSELKYETVSLVLSLTNLNPKVISTSHVPTFLSSYQATLSKTDQSLLELLQLYEKNGASVWDWRPCLWGSTAANYYSVRSKSVQPLWKQPRMAQVLNLLEDDIVMNTIKRFPLDRSLQACSRLEIENGEKVYDPAFLLPLIAHLLSAGADVQHWSMIKSGAFAIALASLASHSSDTRSAAYLVISRFHSHLSSGDKDQQLWQNFINTIREGVVELGSDCPQLPTLCTTFLARSTLALSEVEHPLFSPLYNFFLAKPFFSFSSVPGFLELIHSNDVKYQDHQEWILEVLRDGTRRKQDADLLFKCFALKILLNLYSFAYVSSAVKILILQLISSLALVREHGHTLAISYGLMPWMNRILDNADGNEVTEIIKLLNKFSHYKSCLVHIKLILVSLAERTVSPNDILVILKTLNSSKFLYAVNRTDIQVLIDTVSSIRGTSSVSHAKYMLDYGACNVTDATSNDDIVSNLNSFIFEWLRIK